MIRQDGYERRGTAAVPVGVGTTFAYDGETVTIVEMAARGHGNVVVVEDRGGKRRYQLLLSELLSSGRASIITSSEGLRADDDIELAGVLLSNLSERQLAEVTDKADHVREVITGYRSGCAAAARPGEPRPQYAPDLPLACRYEAKAKEVGRSVRTIQRWSAAYREHGEAGLAYLSATDPMGRTDPRWLATAKELMVENANSSRPNRKNIMLQTRARLEELLDAWRKARAAAGHDNAAPVVVRTNTIVGSDTNEIGVVAGRGPKAGADLRRLADYEIDEVFFETGRGPMPIAEQLDLVDEWRSELGA